MKITTLGYIEFNNKYLMLYRNINKSDGSLGKWLGIGGKFKTGEDADTCFLREVFEETGISLTTADIQRRGIIDFSSEVYESERMFLYTAQTSSNEFNSNCNEGNLKWIEKSEILDLDMWEGDHIFLERLLNNDSFFTLSLQYGGQNGDTLVNTIENQLVLSDVDSLSDPLLNLYTNLNENQLKHVYEPLEGVFIAETPVVIERAINEGYTAESLFCEHSLLFEATKYNHLNIPLFSCAHENMSKLTGYNLTHGMLSVMKRKPLLTVSEFVSNPSIKRIAFLEDVMNPTNIGAIVRSAAALGIDALLLTSGCADPLYRRAIRVSMGNIFALPFAIGSCEDCIDALKNNEFKIISMALSDNSYNLGDPKLSELKDKKIAITFGTESTGISNTLLSASDYVVKIPMSNNVDSLNVAAASAVAFWELCI